jgi:hypothetical protein
MKKVQIGWAVIRHRRHVLIVRWFIDSLAEYNKNEHQLQFGRWRASDGRTNGTLPIRFILFRCSPYWPIATGRHCGIRISPV